MSDVVVDLYGLDPNYVGGVSRFSVGLTTGLINNLGEDNVTIICSSENSTFIREKFNASKIIEVVKRPFDSYVVAAISIVAWLLKFPRLLYLSKFYRRFKALETLNCPYVIVPTSTVNFFQLPCSILCIHDIQHELFPDNFRLITRAYRWAQYRLSATHAERIQVSSEYISDNLKELLGESIRRKTVKIYEGFNKNEFSPELPKRAPENSIETLDYFIYYPAQLWRHKNHATVIAGLALFNLTNSVKLKLVLSGRDYGELHNVRSMALNNSVELLYLGVVEDIQMRWLYSNAIAVVAAGYHESSSLPVREAIACGGRVVAANIQPNQEISFLKSLHLFDTFSPDSFSDALSVMWDERNSDLGCDLFTSNQWAVFDNIFEWNNVSLRYIEVLKKINSA